MTSPIEDNYSPQWLESIGISPKYIDPNYERLSKDEYFMAIAHLVSMRSHDAQTQHGSVAVKDGRIISTGFNGFLPGGPDKEWPNLRPNKLKFIIHSEVNCIYNGDISQLRGATLYCTGRPCVDCTKQLISVGLLDWVVGPKKYQEDEIDARRKQYLIDYYGIKIREYSLGRIEIKDKYVQKN